MRHLIEFPDEARLGAFQKALIDIAAQTGCRLKTEIDDKAVAWRFVPQYQTPTPAASAAQGSPQ